MFDNVKSSLLKALAFVGVFAVIGAAVGFAYTKTIKPTYTASVVEYGKVVGGKSADQLVAMNTLLANRATSYMALVQTQTVLQPVIDELHLPTTVSDLSGRVTSQLDPQTVLIQIAVTDTDAARAAKTASAIGRSLSSAVSKLDDYRSTGLNVELTTVQDATVPTIPSSPKAPINVLLGAIGGALLGYLVSALLAFRGRRAPGPASDAGPSAGRWRRSSRTVPAPAAEHGSTRAHAQPHPAADDVSAS